jgi:hypothetical protein
MVAALEVAALSHLSISSRDRNADVVARVPVMSGRVQSEPKGPLSRPFKEALGLLPTAYVMTSRVEPTKVMMLRQ